MDFMSDTLATRRRVRILNIMDDCTREILAAHADYSIAGEGVVDVLKRITDERGKPDQIRVDNGPEFLSKSFTGWCNREGIAIKYIQPGKPTQNAYIERLNRTYREDILDAYQFENLEQLRILSDEWQYQYNHYHPHQSLSRKTPVAAREEMTREAHSKQMIEQEHSKDNRADEHTIISLE